MTAHDHFDWYRTPSGRRAARLLRTALRPQLQHQGTTRLLTLGAPSTILLGYPAAKVERVAAVDAGGCWPPNGPNATLAADHAQLPFDAAVFDQALVMHSLECAEKPAALLRELWRVLAPAGELLLVVPNRAGLWALAESNPFGQGRPYGRGGLRRTLTDAMFEVAAWRTALAAPPLRGLAWTEPLLARTAPGLGGVHVVRAVKRDGLAPVDTRLRARAMQGTFAPAAAATQADAAARTPPAQRASSPPPRRSVVRR